MLDVFFSDNRSWYPVENYMTDRPKTGKRVQVYIPADLVEQWERTPRYERSAQVAKALRLFWSIDSQIDSNQPPRTNDEAPAP